ncbi:MAG TPA: hypothetical protein VE398_13170 [Acidobacteriota bacterium]|nr:hypothetical protein [Acidobacteriota bacterium]
MVEFTSETQRSFRPATLFISLGVIAAALVGLYFFVRYQKSIQPPASTGPIVIQGLLRPGEANFEYYKSKVFIENVKATLGISFSGSRNATISGIIVNDGDRKLEALEIHIKLFDAFGKPSKEKTAYALRPGAGYSSKPMEPLEKRTFTIGIDAVEQYWNPKQIEYEITGLKYQ